MTVEREIPDRDRDGFYNPVGSINRAVVPFTTSGLLLFGRGIPGLDHSLRSDADQLL